MSKTYVTHDMSLAAWLLMKGLKLLSADRKAGKFVFKFDDPLDEAHQLILEFASTPFAVYDSHLRTLRSLVKK